MMSFLLFLDRHLWLYRLMCGALLALTGWLALQPLLRPGPGGRAGWGRPALFLSAMTASLFALRYPIFFLPTYLNIDEAQMLAQAITFRVHPIPWLDVDGGTGGPLDSYALLWCVPFGVNPTYLTTRICGLLCVAGMLIFLHFACRRVAGEGLARLALLPFLLFFGFTTFPDWTHYSSEHLPILLLGIGLYLLAVLRRRPAAAGRAFLLGLALGLLPFAKLQASLAGACIGFAAMGLLAGSGRPGPGLLLRRLIPLMAGALLPAAILLSLLAATGAFYDFWQSDIQMQRLVAQGRFDIGLDPRWAGFFVGSGLPAKLKLLRIMVFNRYIETAFPIYLTAIVAVFAAGRLLLPKPALPGTLRRAALFALLLAAITVWSVVTPGRRFPHYMALLMAPLPLLLAVSLRIVHTDLRLRIRGRTPLLPVVLWATGLAGGAAMVLGGRFFIRRIFHSEIPDQSFPPVQLPDVFYPFLGLVLLLLIDAGLLAKDRKERGTSPFPWRWPALLTYLLPFFILPAVELARLPNAYAGKIAAHLATPLPAIDRAILHFRPPGGRVVVWGWQPDYLAETGSVMGAREATSYFLILHNRMQDYYQACFMRDLRVNRPEVFIQAVTPRNFFFRDPAVEGIQFVPGLADYIAGEYREVQDIDGIKLFLRRDLPLPPD